MADSAVHEPEASDVADDLLWRELLAQQSPNDAEILVGVVKVAPTLAAPGTRSALCLRGPVATIGNPASVALVLSANGAAVAPQLPSNLGLIESLLSKVRNYIPLTGGKLLILHHDLSLLAGRKNRGVSQITSTNLYRENRVALSI